jgi:peptide/nickel transport system ATP-binding protein
MSAPVLEVEGLSVRLPTPAGALRAVDDVSFAIAPGKTLCVVGESGSGKSMTALAVMGLLPRKATVSARRLALEGRALSGLGDSALSDLRGGRMAMVFQDPMTSLNPVWTIGEQLQETWARHRGGGRAEARAQAIAGLERVGVAGAEGRLKQYPHQLSGGLRQRVMIAMALICEPKLLIADEPTTALDVTIQLQILKLLKDLQREMGLALLFISHDLGVVARIADEVVVMYAGQIVERAPAAALFAAPRHPYTQGLIAALPVPGRLRRGAPLPAIPGVVTPPIGEAASCRFAPRCPHARAACMAGPVAFDGRARCIGVAA